MKRKNVEYQKRSALLRKSFIECRISDSLKFESNRSMLDIYTEAEKKNLLQVYDNRSLYFCYKTDYNNEKAIVIFFVIDANEKTSTDIPEYVISIIDTIESMFFVKVKHYKREFSEKKKKFVELLQVVCSEQLIEDQNKTRQYISF